MFNEPMVPISAYFSFSFLTDIAFSPKRIAIRKTHPLKQACRERLECGRRTSGTVEFPENTLDMGANGAGADTQCAGGFLITRTIDNQPEDVHSWGGMAISEAGEPPMPLPFQMTLGGRLS